LRGLRRTLQAGQGKEVRDMVFTLFCKARDDLAS